MPSVLLKAEPYKESTSGAASGDKAWGKDAKAAPSTTSTSTTINPTTAATTPGKVYLSESTRGFEMPSSCKMHDAERVYGKEEVIALAPTVNMYKVKPVYD